MRNHASIPLSRPHNATWRETKQLGSALLLVVPYVAVVCLGAARLVGARAAVAIGIGLIALTAVTFVLLIAASLAITSWDDAQQARLHDRFR